MSLVYSLTVGVYLLVQLISGNNVLKINWLQLSGKFLILFSVFGLLSSANSRKWPKIASSASSSQTWRQPGRNFFPAPGADAGHRQTGPDQSVAKLAPVGADYFFCLNPLNSKNFSSHPVSSVWSAESATAVPGMVFFLRVLQQ